MMSKWQTMDTAPKDGTWVLLMGGRTTEDFYSDRVINEQKRIVVCKWFEDNWVFCYWDGEWREEYQYPAMWAPLLELPPRKISYSEWKVCKKGCDPDKYPFVDIEHYDGTIDLDIRSYDVYWPEIKRYRIKTIEFLAETEEETRIKNKKKYELLGVKEASQKDLKKYLPDVIFPKEDHI